MLVRTTAGNKQIRMATSLSGAILGWDEHLEFIQDASYDATSLSEQRERERRVVQTKDLSVKQQQQKKVKTVIKQRAASTFCPPDGGKRHARGTRESASGGPAG